MTLDYLTKMKVWALEQAGETDFIVHPGPTGDDVKAWYKGETGVDCDAATGEVCVCNVVPPDRVLTVRDEEDDALVVQDAFAWALQAESPCVIASTCI